MSELPAPLAKLKDAYVELLSRVDSGTLDPNAALDQLASNTVTDSTGARWSVSDQSEPDDIVFLRSVSGGPAVPALSSQWNLESRPAIKLPDEIASSEWDNTGWNAPSWADDAEDPSGDVPPGVWNDAGWPGEDLLSPPDVPAATSSFADPENDAPSKAAKQPRSPRLSTGQRRSLAEPVLRLWRDNRRSVIFTLVGLAAVVVLVMFSRRDSRPDTATSTTVATTVVDAGCPALVSNVTGLNEKGRALLACVGDPQDQASLSRYVLKDTGGTWNFDPTVTVDRELLSATAGQLYSAATKASPKALVPTANPPLSVYVSLAREAGLAETGELTQKVTVGEAALTFSRTMAKIAGAAPAASAASAASATKELNDTGLLEETDPAQPLNAAVWLETTAAVLARTQQMTPAVTATTNGPFSDPPATTTTAASIVAAPSTERVGIVLSALVSADANLLRQAMPSLSDSADDALELALYAGLRPTGLELAAQAAPQLASANTAVSRASITRAGVVLRQVQLDWTLVNGNWVLAGWPKTL